MFQVLFYVILQDKGEVPLCIRRHLPVLRGLSPLGPLYVSLGLQTLHTGTFPGCAIHARKAFPSDHQRRRGVSLLVNAKQQFTLFFFLPPSDVRRGRVDLEKATKTRGRGRRPSCGVLISLPLRRTPHSPTSCHPAKMTRKKQKRVLTLAEWMRMFLLRLTEIHCQGRGRSHGLIFL